MAAALSWYGWRVQAVDVLIDKDTDLADPTYQAKLRPVLQAADAAVWAPDCSTLTRARERPIPGHARPPQPLRSSAEVRGLASLTGQSHQRVKTANAFLDFTLAEVEAGAARGAVQVIENPLRSYLWEFEQLNRIRKLRGLPRRAYDACAWLGPRCKAQA